MPLPLLAAIPAVAAIGAKTTAVIGAVAAAIGVSKTIGTSATVASIAASKIPVPPVPAPDSTLQMLQLALAKLSREVRNSVKVQPRIGSILYTGMVFELAEHSGVYVGNGEVVELQRNGRIKKVSVKEFIDVPLKMHLESLEAIVYRQPHLIPLIEEISGTWPVYVSSNNEGAVGSEYVAQRALDMVGSSRNYNLILDNCHQFCSGCITGNFENSDNFLWMLKHTAEKAIGADDWLVWDR